MGKQQQQFSLWYFVLILGGELWTQDAGGGT